PSGWIVAGSKSLRAIYRSPACEKCTWSHFRWNNVLAPHPARLRGATASLQRPHLIQVKAPTRRPHDDGAMDRRIAIALEPAREIAVDGAIVAHTLGLDVATFRELMDARKIAMLCERGTG